jgi:hypothetical protein
LKGEIPYVNFLRQFLKPPFCFSGLRELVGREDKKKSTLLTKERKTEVCCNLCCAKNDTVENAFSKGASESNDRISSSHGLPRSFGSAVAESIRRPSPPDFAEFATDTCHRTTFRRLSGRRRETLVAGGCG